MSDQENKSIAHEIDDFGNLKLPERWTPEIAKELALRAGISNLTDEQWKVVEFAANFFKRFGTVPSRSKILRDTRHTADSLASLFPPSATESTLSIVLKIAGISTVGAQFRVLPVPGSEDAGTT
jgi:tRNA 2-thiouridine synthesizing protein E